MRSGPTSGRAEEIPIRTLRLALFVLVGATLAGSADAAVYQCAVRAVAAFTNRVHVQCTQPYNTTISYFAAPASDRDLASRMEAIGLVAQVTGTVVNLYFNPSDTSGTNFGCQASDCQRITGIEVVGPGPLASAPAGSLSATIASTLPEPGAPAEALAAGATLLVWRRRRAGS
jgi:hypothetical protein